MLKIIKLKQKMLKIKIINLEKNVKNKNIKLKKT